MLLAEQLSHWRKESLKTWIVKTTGLWKRLKTTDIPIHAIRKGEVPGIHEITYESDVDTISIKHDAKSRAGFALGAVIAAEFTAGKKGFLGMDDMLKF